MLRYILLHAIHTHRCCMSAQQHRPYTVWSVEQCVHAPAAGSLVGCAAVGWGALAWFQSQISHPHTQSFTATTVRCRFKQHPLALERVRVWGGDGS